MLLCVPSNSRRKQQAGVLLVPAPSGGFVQHVPFPKIRPQQKKSIQAAEALLQVISHGYAVGDKLPPERVLAQEMAISRNTLREAIAALQLMGFLEVRHSQGNFIIALPRQEDARQTLSDIFTPDADPFGMVEARIAFEPGVAYLAAERCTPRDLEQLRSSTDRLRRALEAEDRRGYATADVAFHLGIARCTRNECVVQTISSLVGVLCSPLWQAMKQPLPIETIKVIRLHEHEAVLTALEARDAAGAAALMRAHLQASKERFLVEADKDQPA